MKIGLLGSKNSIESQWLFNAAKKRGHTLYRMSIKDFSFTYENGNFSCKSKFDLQNIDIFLVRGIYKNVSVNNVLFNYSTEYFLLFKFIKKILKKPIVDSILEKGIPILSKMSTAFDLRLSNLPYPKTEQFISKDKILNEIEKFKFPIIIKDPAGRKGQNIYKINSKNELKRFLKKCTDFIPFLFQEFLPNDGDIRVFVIGYKAIGAMKRFVIPEDFRANISQGAIAKKIELSTPIKLLAEKAARFAGIELAGVDLIESNGKYYVIEINRTPQFKGFRKYTKINPAPFIIKFLEKKFKDAKKYH